MCVYICTHAYIPMYICMHTLLCMCRIHVCMCVYVCMCICMCVHMYIMFSPNPLDSLKVLTSSETFSVILFTGNFNMAS